MGTVCEKPKLQKQRTFYEVKEDKQTNQMDIIQDSKTAVKLEFTIENLEKNQRYQIQARFDDSKIFKTEVVTSHRNIISFNSCYICEYYFEKQQTLWVSLYKNYQLIKEMPLTLGYIVGSPGSCLKTEIYKPINLIISAESVNNKSYVEVDFVVDNFNFIDLSKDKNKFSYLITSNGRKVYGSESIKWHGKFEKPKIPEALIKNGFTITFIDSRGEAIMPKQDTVESFCSPKEEIYVGLNMNGKYIYIYNKSRLIRNYSLIDYIKNGITIKLTIGIDYTSSNKEPNDPLSLHYLGSGMNDYEQAIRSCGMVVAYYDYNQMFPVYGFGAVLNGENKPNMCFNVNFQQNPEIYTIDNVLQEYRNSFNNLILAGPTEFCPIIKKVIENIKRENDPLKYHILLILTDGIIYDMRETIDALVECSFLPLSVIIIGIGNDHFQEMIELDGDDKPLTNSRGIKRKRDLVQFVPYNRYKYNPTKLAEQVLEEVPRQIIEFYSMNGIYPENLRMANIGNMNGQQFQPNFNEMGYASGENNIYNNN